MDTNLDLNGEDVLVQERLEPFDEIGLSIEYSDCAGTVNAFAKIAQNWTLGRVLEARSFFDSLGRLCDE